VIILDTNVLSELMRRGGGSPAVVEWIDAQPAAEFAVTAITVAEVFHGIRRLAEGRRKMALEAAAVRMFEEDLAHRALAFDHAAALAYADIVVCREQAGRPISMADAQIAAIARQHRATLATRNVRDFDGLDLELVDPWVRR
jgi:predicted nucleic acid-binding protein